MREKLIELLGTVVPPEELLCAGEVVVSTAKVADHLIANGISMQSDIAGKLSRAVSRQRTRSYGQDDEFNEKMAGYNPSAFCAGFDYAMQLVLGEITQCC